MEIKDEADFVKACTKLVLDGTALVARLRKTWQNTLSANMRLLNVDPRDVHHEKKWRVIGWCQANPAASRTPP